MEKKLNYKILIINMKVVKLKYLNNKALKKSKNLNFIKINKTNFPNVF